MPAIILFASFFFILFVSIFFFVCGLLKGTMHTISPGRNRVNFLTCSPLTYSMALDAYHIDSVNTCYDYTAVKCFLVVKKEKKRHKF